MIKFLQFFIPALLILIISGLVTLFLIGQKKPNYKRDTPAVVKSLSVTEVKYTDNTPSIIALGKVESKSRLSLISEVSGKIIPSSFKLKVGKSFTKGQVLVKIDATMQQNNLKITTSDLIMSLAEMLPDMKIDMPNEFTKWETFTSELAFDNIPELPKYESNKEKIFVTMRGIYTKYYNLKNQKVTLNKHTIRAPFSGTVASTNVTVGSMASPNSPLATIVDTKQYEVKLPFPQTVINEINVGMNVELFLKDMNYSVDAKIVRVSKVVDTQNQTQFAIAQFSAKKDSPIVDGSYVTATITANNIKSFKIPRSALFKDKYLISVENIRFLEEKKTEQPKGDKKGKELKKTDKIVKAPKKEVGDAKLSAVEIVFRDNRFVYITSGVEENTLVVNEPTQDIDNNTLITPVK